MTPSREYELQELLPNDNSDTIETVPPVAQANTTLDGGAEDPTSPSAAPGSKDAGLNEEPSGSVYIRQKTLVVRFKRVSYNNCRSHAGFYKDRPDFGQSMLKANNAKHDSWSAMTPAQDPPPVNGTEASTPTADTEDKEVEDLMNDASNAGASDPLKNEGDNTPNLSKSTVAPKPEFELLDATEREIMIRYKYEWAEHAKRVTKSGSPKPDMLKPEQWKKTLGRVSRNVIDRKQFSRGPSHNKQVTRYVMLETHLQRKNQAKKLADSEARQTQSDYDPTATITSTGAENVEMPTSPGQADRRSIGPLSPKQAQHAHTKSSSFDQHFKVERSVAESAAAASGDSTATLHSGETIHSESYIHVSPIEIRTDSQKQHRQKQINIRSGRQPSESTSSSQKYPEQRDRLTELPNKPASDAIHSRQTSAAKQLLNTEPLDRVYALTKTCLLKNSPGMLKFYESEEAYKNKQDPVEVVPLDRVWACYQRDFSEKKQRFRLELFTDDGFITLCFEDDETLHAWYKEVNDEVSNARDKNTVTPHKDPNRPHEVYTSHHEVRVRRITEVKDHYGTKEEEVQDDQKEEIKRFIGDRWLCFEMMELHLVKPIYHKPDKPEKPTLKRKKSGDAEEFEKEEEKESFISPTQPNPMIPRHTYSKAQIKMTHDNLIMFKRGKCHTPEKPWLTIIMGLKDTVFSWQQADSRDNFKGGMLARRRQEQENKLPANSPQHAYSSMGNRRNNKVFRDPEAEFPNNDGSTYVKIQLEIKDWNYCAKIHDELAEWKRRLSTRLMKVADVTLDNQGHHVGNTSRDFYKINEGEIKNMKTDALMAYQFRMETHKNPHSIEAYKLVRAELIKREPSVIAATKNDFDISKHRNKGSYEIPLNLRAEISMHSTNRGKPAAQFTVDEPVFDEEDEYVPTSMMPTVIEQKGSSGDTSKDVTPTVPYHPQISTPTSTPPPGNMSKPVEIISSVPPSAKHVPAERHWQQHSQPIVITSPRETTVSQLGSDHIYSDSDYVKKHHKPSLHAVCGRSQVSSHDDQRSVRIQRGGRSGRTVLDGVEIKTAEDKLRIVEDFSKAIGESGYDFGKDTTLEVVSQSPTKPKVHKTQQSLEENPLFPPVAVQPTFQPSTPVTPSPSRECTSEDTETTRITDSTMVESTSTVRPSSTAERSSSQSRQGDGTWNVLSNASSDTDDCYITAR